MITEKDLILIYFEEQPMAYARIESIAPDVKKGWYVVKLLILQVPLQVVSWILRDVYINGETFTMGGKQMRFEAVVAPQEPVEPVGETEKNAAGKDPAKVISLSELKKK